MPFLWRHFKSSQFVRFFAVPGRSVEIGIRKLLSRYLHYATCLVTGVLLAAFAAPAFGDDAESLPDYKKDIQPLLAKYCYDCHGNGEKSGEVAFDNLKVVETENNKSVVPGTPELWWKALRNVRAGLMPAQGSPQPKAEELQLLERWIKFVALKIDPKNPDPGHVTIRRLNRNEYRRTIQELMNFSFKAEDELPPDDTGYGFDNIGEVLSISPLLMEKYMQAAEKIVADAVPTRPPENSSDDSDWKAYRRFFSKDQPPASQEDRAEYVKELLAKFTRQAFRRPVDEATIDRLQKFAEAVDLQPGKRFEEGIAQAMVAVLASPRFLFRVEEPQRQNDSENAVDYPLIDEHSLASRLSYFLWVNMPNQELLKLAEQGELRKNLRHQVERMMKNERFEYFSKYFVGQWLQSRDVIGIAIDPRAIAAREDAEAREILAKIRENRRQDGDVKERRRLRGLLEKRSPAELTGALRNAMRHETEMAFAHIVKEDRSVLELLDANYTFVNDILAEHYGLPAVEGHDMRRVELPPNSPRGGVLTQGTMLVVTSNPTRTSPVKRGLFILDNILGIPPPPPPPNIPALEAAKKEGGERELSMRELMEVHRNKPLCNSCHSRMDPLGLGLENFNAMGKWRESDLGVPVDPSGELVTGEQFKDVRELKKILVNHHRLDFYCCLTEKLLTYALGRGLTYQDVHTVDIIVDRLERSGGRFSELLFGVIESVPFQKQRAMHTANGSPTSPIGALMH